METQRLERNETKIEKARNLFAAFQSIIPGLGHIYKGYYYPGVVIMLLSLGVFYLGGVLFLATIGFSVLGPLLFVILVALHACQAEDHRKHHLGIL